MTIVAHQQEDLCVLEITGEIKFGEPTVELRRVSRHLVGQGQRFFILDMLKVPWLDSSGIGEVFACYKRARERQGVVKLVLQGKCLSLFTLTALNKVFEIYDTRAATLASF